MLALSPRRVGHHNIAISGPPAGAQSLPDAVGEHREDAPVEPEMGSDPDLEMRMAGPPLPDVVGQVAPDVPAEIQEVRNEEDPRRSLRHRAIDRRLDVGLGQLEERRLDDISPVRPAQRRRDLLENTVRLGHAAPVPDQKERRLHGGWDGSGAGGHRDPSTIVARPVPPSGHRTSISPPTAASSSRTYPSATTRPSPGTDAALVRRPVVSPPRARIAPLGGSASPGIARRTRRFETFLYVLSRATTSCPT